MKTQWRQKRIFKNVNINIPIRKYGCTEYIYCTNGSFSPMSYSWLCACQGHLLTRALVWFLSLLLFSFVTSPGLAAHPPWRGYTLTNIPPSSAHGLTSTPPGPAYILTSTSTTGFYHLPVPGSLSKTFIIITNTINTSIPQLTISLGLYINQYSACFIHHVSTFSTLDSSG